MSTSEKKDVSLESKHFEIITNKAVNFYDLLLTKSTTFLGGLTFFLEKVVPFPKDCTMPFLVLGYVGFIVSMIFIAVVRLLNITAGDMCIHNDREGAKCITKISKVLCWIDIFSLAAGIVFMSIFFISSIKTS